MLDLFITSFSQAIVFLPLAFAIYISFNLLNAADMTLDSSFVAGAGIFARAVSAGFNPLLATLLAMLMGVATGAMVALFQRKQRLQPLLAGILATFILSGCNIILMAKPNINLLEQHTLLSFAFQHSENVGYLWAGLCALVMCLLVLLLLLSPLGLKLRAFGDNAWLLTRYGLSLEKYRFIGFALTNCLAASAGMLTAQCVSYADINMGFGVTLTGLGAVILGKEILLRFTNKSYLRPPLELIACVLGVAIYFFMINGLLRLQIDPIYLKILLGVILVFFIRSTAKNS